MSMSILPYQLQLLRFLAKISWFVVVGPKLLLPVPSKNPKATAKGFTFHQDNLWKGEKRVKVLKSQSCRAELAAQRDKVGDKGTR